MKDLTIDTSLEDDEIETPEEVKEPKEKEVLQPKDNTMTIVLLILLTVVIGLIFYYNSKKEKE